MPTKRNIINRIELIFFYKGQLTLGIYNRRYIFLAPAFPFEMGMGVVEVVLS